LVVMTPLPPPSPPSRPNASRRWTFRWFRSRYHHHHRLPRIQTRAGGGLFRDFDTPGSGRLLHHLHLPRVQTRAGGGFFQYFDPMAAFAVSTALPHYHHLPRVQTRTRGGFFGGFTLLQPPPPFPPPSRPNASRRWIISWVGCTCRLLHLPRVQTRARGENFRRFEAPPTTTSLAFKREPEVEIFDISTLPTNSTSLASKRESEVDSFAVSTPLSPPPPSRSNASRRWSFSTFRRSSHLLHLPRVQKRAGGGNYRSFDAPPTNSTPPSRSNAS
jgi:hypothetical protein